MNLKDYYQILGVSGDASSDDIRKAFRQLALRYHPDRNSSSSKEAEKKFKEINEAYGVLIDDQKRRQYDRLKSWPSHRWETIVMEDTFKDSIDLNLIRELLRTVAELDPSFRVFNRPRSWGCKRQPGQRCRGRWRQNQDLQRQDSGS